MDPHKRSATIEVIDEREQVLAQGRYGTDTDGYQAMLAAGRRFPDRVWAVEGCSGIGRHIAQRLIADGEVVLDVRAKLSARARVFATGHSAARPIRSTRIASPWWACAARHCGDRYAQAEVLTHLGDTHHATDYPRPHATPGSRP